MKTLFSIILLIIGILSFTLMLATVLKGLFTLAFGWVLMGAAATTLFCKLSNE